MQQMPRNLNRFCLIFDFVSTIITEASLFSKNSEKLTVRIASLYNLELGNKKISGEWTQTIDSGRLPLKLPMLNRYIENDLWMLSTVII